MDFQGTNPIHELGTTRCIDVFSPTMAQESRFFCVYNQKKLRDGKQSMGISKNLPAGDLCNVS